MVVQRALGRLGNAILVSLPGLVLGALYARRLAILRNDPSASPGTPHETWLALFTAAVVALAARWAVFAGSGRMSLTMSFGAFIALSAVSSALIFAIWIR